MLLATDSLSAVGVGLKLTSREDDSRNNNCSGLQSYGENDVFSIYLRIAAFAAGRVITPTWDYVRAIVHPDPDTQNASHSVPVSRGTLRSARRVSQHHKPKPETRDCLDSRTGGPTLQ